MSEHILMALMPSPSGGVSIRITEGDKKLVFALTREECIELAFELLGHIVKPSATKTKEGK